jgi:hypothetical protein
MNDGVSSDDEVEEASNTSMSEIERVQTECAAMVQHLKILEKVELDLQCQLEILAREALLCGFSQDVVEPPAPKRRRTAAPAAKKEEA